MAVLGRAAITVYLGLGSNLGDRLSNLKRALSLLAQELTVCRVSSVYETVPWGYRDQPHFLNCVCHVDTFLEPGEVLALVKDVERRVGRLPSVQWGPRVIDVDMLLFGNRVIEEAGLKIPHPRLWQRAFVLVPLAEIAPKLVHPVCGLTILELLERVEGKDGVRLFSPPLEY